MGKAEVKYRMTVNGTAIRVSNLNLKLNLDFSMELAQKHSKIQTEIAKRMLVDWIFPTCRVVSVAVGVKNDIVFED